MYPCATYDGQDGCEFLRKRLPDGRQWAEPGGRVQRVEIWASGIEDAGVDHCVAVLFDTRGDEISRKKTQGY